MDGGGGGGGGGWSSRRRAGKRTCVRVTQRNCNYVRAGVKVCGYVPRMYEHVFGLACTCVVTGGRGSKRRRGATQTKRGATRRP